MNKKQNYILIICLKEIRLCSQKNIQIMVENIFESVVAKEESNKKSEDSLGTKLIFEVTGLVPQIKTVQKIPFIDGVYNVSKHQSKFLYFTANKKSTMKIQLVHNNRIQDISFKLNNFLQMSNIQHQITAQYPEKQNIVEPLNIFFPKKKHNQIEIDFLLYAIPSPYGTLHLIVIQAQLTVKSLLKLDPYLKVRYKNKVEYTHTKVNADLNPVWNRQFLFEIQDIGDQINFQIWDENVLINSAVGENSISVLDLGLLQHSNKYKVGSKQLFNGQKKVGILKYEYKFQINYQYDAQQD